MKAKTGDDQNQSPGHKVPATGWYGRLRDVVGRVFSLRRVNADFHRVADEEEEPRYRPIDWRLITRLFSLLKPYRKQYALGVSLGVLMVVLEMMSPLFIRAIIDGTTAFVSGTLKPMPTESEAIFRVVGIVGLWAITLSSALILQRITILIMTGAGERVQFNLRKAIFNHLQTLSLSFYDRTRLGRIISRCTSDIGSLREINVWGIDTLVKNTVMMLMAGVMLFTTEPRLFLAVAWLGGVLYVCNRIYRNKIGLAYQVAREGYTRVATNLAENITGVRVVTAFNREGWNLGAFNRLQEANTINNIRAARINGVYQPLLHYIGLIGKVIILLYGGYLVASGRLPGGVGAVVAAFLYWEWFMAPILNFGNFYNQLMMAMAGAERIFNLLDTPPEVADIPGARVLPRIVGHVRFEHVTFGYKSDRPVLHDIDFEALPGRTVALVGPTGGGKSSMISLIARFYLPQHGRVLVDGHDLRHVTGESLHRQMGLVQQTNYLFSGTVADNIRYPRPHSTRAEVMAAARAIGAYEVVASLKDGFDTDVGERGANISLGQRQLICFIRAYLADPRIFLLDEATSAVDTATELLVQQSLERLRAGRTTFIVAHRLSTILRSDCILVVDGGRIVESGNHSELLRAQGRYARLYEEFSRVAPEHP